MDNKESTIPDFIAELKESTVNTKYYSDHRKPFYGHLEIHFQNGERGHIVKRETIK